MVYMKRNATTFLYGCFQLRYTYQCRREGRDPLRFLATYFRSAKKFFRSESAQIPLPAYSERQYVLRYTIFHYNGKFCGHPSQSLCKQVARPAMDKYSDRIPVCTISSSTRYDRKVWYESLGSICSINGKPVSYVEKSVICRRPGDHHIPEQNLPWCSGPHRGIDRARRQHLAQLR